MRFTANQPPLKGPYFFIASAAYSEQVGVYLQLGGKIGDKSNLYALIIARNIKLNDFEIIV
jgi:hypothetical protein